MVNRKLVGLLVAGLLLGTGAVNAEESAFPSSADEAGIRLPSQSTYADQHRGGLGQELATGSVVESTFPKGVDEAGIRLPSQSTYADAHRGKMMESMQAEVRQQHQPYAID